ncbi:MAG TPA: hypothetical protein VJ438_02140 [Candidatus Nanoarchaeia archaeon]|nr:hypothetical protein [Candidatus Nanoarchaeia archaeon]
MNDKTIIVKITKKQKDMLGRAVEKSKRSISSICREGILKQVEKILNGK